ncbi:hypothetical protein KIN20_021372 [Parelaphostrongylus tenuis]|uniref:Uncharacterized protein n=1 Tax=Parelaphostrongylus tenuis TaxID=148309 RepID=A0AAD5MSP4_PARTN|nr:hypothetical protein KIN20_021372 [Parelaphostrongylus tenuis]
MDSISRHWFQATAFTNPTAALVVVRQLERTYDALEENYPMLIRRKRGLFQQDSANSHRKDE